MNTKHMDNWAEKTKLDCFSIGRGNTIIDLIGANDE
jgi:hypothetical protein